MTHTVSLRGAAASTRHDHDTGAAWAAPRALPPILNRMPELAQVILITAVAGGAIPLGAWLARIERLHPMWLEQEFRHGVIAFGGGVLLAAVALVLVPEGVASLSLAAAAGATLAGGVVFMGLDLAVHRAQTPASQLVATLADFLPEAIALGASCATGRGSVMLLGLLITLQNLPEGFNAYREITAGRLPGSRVLAALAAIALLGPAAGVAGYTLLADAPPVVGFIMLFAAGGILYLTFQDLAPQTRLERHWGPPLGAVIGFVVGLTGQMLLHGGAA